MEKSKILVLKVKKINPKATIPTKEHESDAGIDLHCINKDILPTNGVHKLSTGIAIQLPKGFYGQIKERSGYGSSNTITIKAGVIDQDYRGEIKIIVQNCGDYPITIPANTKIAQLVILPIPKIKIKEVDTLSDTKRGQKGFGSSDKK